MILLKSLKIWLFTNLLAVTTWLISNLQPFEFLSHNPNETLSIIMLLLVFGLLFSLPAIPIMSLVLFLADKIRETALKFIFLLVSYAITVCAVLLIASEMLHMKIISEQGDNLLEFTWPYLISAFICIFYVEKRSFFKSNIIPKTIEEEIISHES